MRILLIALGGALGTLMRYGAAQLARRFLSQEWPIGTLAVNVLGCFILALLSEMVLRGSKMPDDVRLAITVGFCGGLTTYSSLNQETMAFIRDGYTHLGLLYFMATVVLCAGASVIGLLCGRMFSP